MTEGYEIDQTAGGKFLLYEIKLVPNPEHRANPGNVPKDIQVRSPIGTFSTKAQAESRISTIVDVRDQDRVVSVFKYNLDGTPKVRR